MNIKSCESCRHCTTSNTPFRLYCNIRGVLLYNPTYCGAYSKLELPEFNNDGPWVEALSDIVNEGGSHNNK